MGRIDDVKDQAIRLDLASISTFCASKVISVKTLPKQKNSTRRLRVFLIGTYFPFVLTT